MIPKFHFSTFIQNYFKNDVGKTYRDVVEAWYQEEEEKKILPTRKTLHPGLNTINSFETFLMTQIIKGKVEKKPLKPGMKSRNNLEVTNMNHQIHFDYARLYTVEV